MSWIEKGDSFSTNDEQRRARVYLLIANLQVGIATFQESRFVDNSAMEALFQELQALLTRLSSFLPGEVIVQFPRLPEELLREVYELRVTMDSVFSLGTKKHGFTPEQKKSGVLAVLHQNREWLRAFLNSRYYYGPDRGVRK